MNGIHPSTAAYLNWLRRKIPLLPADLAWKDTQMRAGVFQFLRATFYRWAETFPEVCKDLARTPEVLGVGDLHVENFGTWRDAEGRLVWGINDFDEAARLPYTVDLVRLTTSAYIALDDAHLHAEEKMVAPAILKGYAEALAAKGKPFVLAELHDELHAMAAARLKDPSRFWKKLNGLAATATGVPSVAKKALMKALPAKDLAVRFIHRQAGLGSLGRRRYTALAQWRGGEVAREAKELAPSAWRFAGMGEPSREILYAQILKRAVRCPDPFLAVEDAWVVRRLAPDCSRIELASLPKNHDCQILLEAMGWETANVHLGSQSAKVLLADLLTRKYGWLDTAASAMADQTRKDWMALRG